MNKQKIIGFTLGASTTICGIVAGLLLGYTAWHDEDNAAGFVTVEMASSQTTTPPFAEGSTYEQAVPFNGYISLVTNTRINPKQPFAIDVMLCPVYDGPELTGSKELQSYTETQAAVRPEWMMVFYELLKSQVGKISIGGQRYGEPFYGFRVHPPLVDDMETATYDAAKFVDSLVQSYMPCFPPTSTYTSLDPGSPEEMSPSQPAGGDVCNNCGGRSGSSVLNGTTPQTTVAITTP